jgi:acetylornithine deacetylase/succinyl-diaminopimelate desuccinylase family protein
MVDEAAVQTVAASVHPDEVVRFARALIAAPSENPGGTEDQAADVAIGILEALGAETQMIRSDAGRPSVIGSLGSGGHPQLVWNGHLDVVPAGSREAWTHDPWAGSVVDGRLIGRGAADMKGPVAAALAATAALRRAGADLEGTLTFHLAADEELAGIHGTRVLWERGFIDQDACIVGEPSELCIGLAQRGGAWVTATAHGVAAHGSTPELGVNAITSMARYLLRLDEVLPPTEHALVGRPTVNAALITGGTAPNVVPDRCEADIDRRVIPGEDDPDGVLAPFRALAERVRAEHPEVRIDTAIREWTEAAEAPADSAIADAARAALSAEGREPQDVGFTGITDARFYLNQARMPGVILGPGSLTVAHTANESIAVDELVTGARVYARIFASFLA